MFNFLFSSFLFSHFLFVCVMFCTMFFFLSYLLNLNFYIIIFLPLSVSNEKENMPNTFFVSRCVSKFHFISSLTFHVLFSSNAFLNLFTSFFFFWIVSFISHAFLFYLFFFLFSLVFFIVLLLCTVHFFSCFLPSNFYPIFFFFISACLIKNKTFRTLSSQIPNIAEGK